MDNIKKKIERENRTIFNAVSGVYRTRDRLKHYREEAAHWKEKHPDALTQYHTWQHHAKSGTARLWFCVTVGTRKGEGRQEKIFSDNLDDVGEYQGEADQFASLDHTGWYADHFQDSLIKGGVCRMRTARGALYIPVTFCTDWDGVTHYIGDAEHVDKGASEEDHETARKEAARSADHYAEQEAEEARDYAAKDQAERDIEDAREEIHAINKKALPLVREIKTAGQFTPAVCAALREKLADYLEERAEQFALIEKRTREYWSAVEGF